MRLEYEPPETELIRLHLKDIIATSEDEGPIITEPGEGDGGDEDEGPIITQPTTGESGGGGEDEGPVITVPDSTAPDSGEDEGPIV